VLLLAAVGLTTLVAAGLGVARPPVVVPVAIAVGFVLKRLWGPLAGDLDRGATAAHVILVSVVIGATAVLNLVHHGQPVLTDRDPGIITTGAAWIAHQGSLRVDGHVPPLASTPGLRANAYGQQSLDGEQAPTLEIQGAHLLPATMAVGHWIGGPRGLVAVPALLGALALASTFLVGLRLLAPWAAILAVTALAVNLAWITTIRSALTEPLLLACLMAMLWFVPEAVRRASPGPMAVAGVVAALGLTVRLDAALAVVLVLPLLALRLRGRDRRSPDRSRHLMLSFLAGFGLVAGIAAVDLVGFGSYYLSYHRQQALLVAGALTASVLIAAGISAAPPSLLRRWPTGRRPRVSARAAAAAGAATVVVLSAGWAIRPMVETARDEGQRSGRENVEAIQRQEGLAVDGTRTYAETTPTWIAWYVGVPAAAGAVLGVGLAVHRALRGRVPPDAVLLAAAAMPVTLLYLLRPSIWPDHPWAIRRFVPVTIPVVVLLAAWFFQEIGRHVPAIGGRRAPRPLRLAAVGLAAIALVAPPASTTWPVRSARYQAGGLDGIQRVCDAIGRDGAAVVTIERDLAYVLLPAVRGFCGVPVARTSTGIDVSPVDLAAVAADLEASGRSLTLISHDEATLGRAARVTDVRRITMLDTTQVAATLSRPPDAVVPRIFVVWAGEVVPSAH
jgi:hypothetical protein